MGYPLSDDRPVLVGETNPYSNHPENDLYYEPANSAGGRLCRDVLGVTPTEYMRVFRRVNLLRVKWSASGARAAAARLALEGEAPLILLGAKVAAAFSLPFEPFRVQLVGEGNGGKYTLAFCILPHPSGLARAWHQPGAFHLARRAVKLTLSAGVRDLGMECNSDWYNGRCACGVLG